MTEPLQPKALALLHAWTAGESLRKHALAVATCCQAYARLEAEAQHLSPEAAASLDDKYAATGLLHDFDYERHPSLDEHPFAGVAHLRQLGWPEDILHAILAHADYSGVSPVTHLDKTLFACDELSGFITACALVKPSKSILDVDVPGVTKKMKDKAFARAVKREDILHGAELLNITLEAHIATCLAALQSAAPILGLTGTPPASLPGPTP